MILFHTYSYISYIVSIIGIVLVILTKSISLTPKRLKFLLKSCCGCCIQDPNQLEDLSKIVSLFSSDDDLSLYDIVYGMKLLVIVEKYKSNCVYSMNTKESYLFLKRMPIGQFLFNLVTDPHFKRQYTFFTRQTIENKMEKDAYIPIPKQKLGKNPSLRRKSSADDSVKTKGSEAVEESEKKELTEVQVDVPQQEEHPSMNEPEESTNTNKNHSEPENLNVATPQEETTDVVRNEEEPQSTLEVQPTSQEPTSSLQECAVEEECYQSYIVSDSDSEYEEEYETKKEKKRRRKSSSHHKEELVRIEINNTLSSCAEFKKSYYTVDTDQFMYHYTNKENRSEFYQFEQLVDPEYAKVYK